MEDLKSSARTAPGFGSAPAGPTGLISPELALVDPDGAAAARAALPDGSGSAPVGSSGVITPELALVDPDAAAAARAALPDRPWDIALDRARAGRPEAALPGMGATVARDAPIRAARPRRPRVGAAAARRVAFMVVWAVMITGIALLAEVRGTNAPALGVDATSVPSPQTRLPTPVPNAGYVIGARSGFRIGPQGRAIGSFTLPVKCLWGVPLGRVAIGTDRSFSFQGIVRRTDGQRVRVSLSGLFTGPRRAVGSVTVQGPGCVRRPVAFVARLS